MWKLAFLISFVCWLSAGASAQSEGPHVYEVEAINPGLPAAERPANLETPQATLETFMAAGAEEDWLRAAQTLELAFLSEANQERLGPVYARQLYTVIRRAVLLDWAGLPDRPDAVDSTASDKMPLAGEPRRNLRLALINIDERPVSIRLARVKEEGSDPIWIFPRQTVENVPVLYAHFAPRAFETKLPVWAQRQAFWTLAWWEVVALPLIIIGAIGAAGAVYWGLGFLQRHERLAIFRGVIDAIQFPAALLAFAATFAVVQSLVFTFSGVVGAIIDPLQTTVILIAIGAIIVAALDSIIDTVTEHQREDISAPEAEEDRKFYTLLSALRRFLLVLMLLVGIGFVLIQTNIAQTLGFSLLASAGAISLVLAFAARQFLANIMASLQIAFARTALIGDAVLFEDKWSYVEKIGFTHVRLRTWDDRRIIAPVTAFVSETFQNWNRGETALMKYVHLIFDHRADVEKLRGVFEDFLDSEDEIVDKEEAKVQVVGHSAEGMKVRFLFKAPDPATGWSQQCRCREAILKAAAEFDEAARVADGPAYLPREREVRLEAAE